MNNLLETYINELEKVENAGQFERYIHRLDEMMQQERFEPEVIQNIRTKAKYFDNKFSDISTKENYFSKEFGGKKVAVIILQPVKM